LQIRLSVAYETIAAIYKTRNYSDLNKQVLGNTNPSHSLIARLPNLPVSHQHLASEVIDRSVEIVNERHCSKNLWTSQLTNNLSVAPWHMLRICIMFNVFNLTEHRIYITTTLRNEVKFKHSKNSTIAEVQYGRGYIFGVQYRYAAIPVIAALGGSFEIAATASARVDELELWLNDHMKFTPKSLAHINGQPHIIIGIGSGNEPLLDDEKTTHGCYLGKHLITERYDKYPISNLPKSLQPFPSQMHKETVSIYQTTSENHLNGCDDRSIFHSSQRKRGYHLSSYIGSNRALRTMVEIFFHGKVLQQQSHSSETRLVMFLETHTKREFGTGQASIYTDNRYATSSFYSSTSLKIETYISQQDDGYLADLKWLDYDSADFFRALGKKNLLTMINSRMRDISEIISDDNPIFDDSALYEYSKKFEGYNSLFE
jgi:hypothetical protein